MGLRTRTVGERALPYAVMLAAAQVGMWLGLPSVIALLVIGVAALNAWGVGATTDARSLLSATRLVLLPDTAAKACMATDSCALF